MTSSNTGTILSTTALTMTFLCSLMLSFPLICRSFALPVTPMDVHSRTKSHLSSSPSSPEPLVPEENPHADPKAESLAGIRHKDVLDNVVHSLYPAQRLDERNALSRTDGYWPYVQKGKDAPGQYTYGEFDFFFFAQLLDRARQYYEDAKIETETHADADADSHPKHEEESTENWKDKVFVDIGSGTGRLVFSAAALHPNFKECRGLEVLPAIHEMAVDKKMLSRTIRPLVTREVEEKVEQPTDPTESDEPPVQLDDFSNPYSYSVNDFVLAPVEFICGSLDDPYVYLGDADIIFCFSSCMPEAVVGSLAAAIGRQCRPGTVAITTEYMLPLTGEVPPVDHDPRLPSGPFQFRLMEKIDGWSWLMGGQSTAYIQQVVKSQWTEDSVPMEAPELPPEEIAFRAVRQAEEDADPGSFLVGVYNNMVFSGIPERFWPKLDRS